MRLAASASVLILAIMLSSSAHAACVNKYVHRMDGKKVTLTVITGTLTFAEAQKLASDVAAGKATIEWTDKDGSAPMKVLPGAAAVRPMPVACGDRKSGSVISMSFLRISPPKGTIYLKLGSDEIVAVEQQAN